MIQNSLKVYLFLSSTVFSDKLIFLSAHQSFNPLRLGNFNFGNHNRRKKKTFNLIFSKTESKIPSSNTAFQGIFQNFKILSRKSCLVCFTLLSAVNFNFGNGYCLKFYWNGRVWMASRRCLSLYTALSQLLIPKIIMHTHDMIPEFRVLG